MGSVKPVTLQHLGRPSDEILEDLTAHAEKLVSRKAYQCGYPFDMDVNLSGFYTWLVETGLADMTLINVGDPWKTSWDMHETDKYERAVISTLAEKFHFPAEDFWGVLSNGGTDGNMHGLYYGRKTLEVLCGVQPVLYVSEEAHYSVRKLGDILRIETRVIGAGADGRMDMEDLRRQLDSARPVLMAVAVGGTFKGAIDDLRAMNELLEEKAPPAVYRHLDAALFGGYLPWVEDSEARDILNAEKMLFDSVAVSGHKFFAINEPVGIFLCRKHILAHLHHFTVPYLKCDLPTISCSRSGFDALKLYWRIMTTGEEGFRKEAEHALKMTARLQEELRKKGIPTFVNPYSTTVIFPQPDLWVRKKYAMASTKCRFFGEISHVVVMQYFNESLIQELVNDISAGMLQENLIYFKNFMKIN
ncbi:MAG: pyridoxal-dependent decarboxylase [Planctomycetia bacterium]|nr:pyridoxal-dependent decarboxylase [Planctomycetia bacterium]